MESEFKNEKPERKDVKHPFPFRRVQSFVALAIVVFVVVGLAFNIGTGVPSAWGISSIAAVCPLGALEALFGAKEFMFHPVVLLVVSLAAIVLIGKAFCSWACPVPWLKRFFRPGKKRVDREGSSDASSSRSCDITVDDASGESTGGREGDLAAHATCSACKGKDCAEQGCSCVLTPVGGKRDGLRIDSRHAVLAGALASTAVFGFPVFCLVCPIGLTFATLIGLWNLFRFNEPTWGLAVFPVVLILEAVVLRKWCSKICPVSALVSLVSYFNKTFKPKVDASKCLREKGIDCHACVEACPEQVDPHGSFIPECSKCGACVEACPAHAISIKVLPRR